MRRLLVLAALALSSGAVALTVGDQAPILSTDTYVKGSRVDLSRGVHVVEFWATWCHPCIDAMPHLTALAEKYRGKIDFTGVSVWEHGDNQQAQVRRFVASMGPKMGYNVAWDGAAGTMSKEWLTAAKLIAIPDTFVVKDGQILWIGHPMEGLDEALESIVRGDFDLTASKRRFEKGSTEMEKMMRDIVDRTALMRPVNEARKAGDYATAIRALDAAEAQRPDLKSGLESNRYALLAFADSPQLLDLARRFATNDYKDKPQILDALAWESVDPEAKPPVPHPNYAAALVLSRRAVEANGMKSPRLLNTYAYLLYRTGDAKKAVEIQAKAVELASLDPKMSKADVERLRARIVQYGG